MPQKNELDWEEYEAITQYIYRALGEKYGIKVIGSGRNFKVKGKSNVKHQIDVLTEQFDGGRKLLTAIECKYWKKKVNKDIVMKLSETMQDSDISSGIIVCKTGFTRDTVTYAEHKGIKLVKLWEAGENDLDYKKEISIGTVDIHNKTTCSRPNITSIDFGSRTIHFDPAKGAVYYLKLKDASGNEIDLKPYLFAFGETLISQGETLKNTSIDYSVRDNLIVEIGNEQIKVEKLSISGFLTIDNMGTMISVILTDQVWMIMNDLFDKRNLTLSNGGLIWNLPLDS